MKLYGEGGTASTAGNDQLVDGLSALARTLVGITARTLASVDAEVTLPQYRTLVILASRAPLRTVDLASLLGVHPSTATRTCNRLVRRELVARRQQADDRRVAWLSLTEGGKTLVGDVMRRRTAEIRRLLSVADSGRRRTPAELINSLVIAAGEPTEELWWQHWEQSASVPDDASHRAGTVTP
ncbi:MarR family transcriptional regulator [Micromonospora sp. WMMD964]|uniref:MarR family winged helix-turn-helix transcriptional regulator n=1 Tax=Micromonospora sp. WMMD964 TaxID=3016091 RepID=UPI00249C3893|nr:MarR family transcriptional regulator [Micromonospora sp. WMMD964]WFF00250.1 MarR family transcriptional regulator [Micromonospora sp. WMMD964]